MVVPITEPAVTIVPAPTGLSQTRPGIRAIGTRSLAAVTPSSRKRIEKSRCCTNATRFGLDDSETEKAVGETTACWDVPVHPDNSRMHTAEPLAALKKFSNCPLFGVTRVHNCVSTPEGQQEVRPEFSGIASVDGFLSTRRPLRHEFIKSWLRRVRCRDTRNVRCRCRDCPLFILPIEIAAEDRRSDVKLDHTCPFAEWEARKVLNKHRIGQSLGNDV